VPIAARECGKKNLRGKLPWGGKGSEYLEVMAGLTTDEGAEKRKMYNINPTDGGRKRRKPLTTGAWCCTNSVENRKSFNVSYWRIGEKRTEEKKPMYTKHPAERGPVSG